jgi:hypothetical protein
MSNLAIEARQLVKQFPARPGTGDRPKEAQAARLASISSASIGLRNAPLQYGIWPKYGL